MPKTKYKIWYLSETAQRLKYGMSIAEIAEIMDKSPVYVTRLLHRALQKLKDNCESLAEYL